jgi:hypothetical protein
MSFRFSANLGLIIVRLRIIGPTGSYVVRVALDTGATTTMINAGPLVAIGYDPALAANRVQITTGSGVEFVPLVTLGT